MKKWIFIHLIIGLSLAAKAEITFGIRAGINYTSMTQLIDGDVVYGGRAGFSAAGLMDIPLSRKFALRPELSFISQGGGYTLEYIKEPPWERYRRNYYSVQIPVNFTYKITKNDWQFGIYGGPSVSLSTQVKETEGLEERKFRPLDIGVGAGFYVEYHKVFFTIYTHSGLLDRLEEKRPNESYIYQNNVMFSFGYWFRK
jgi:hypothetical protein